MIGRGFTDEIGRRFMRKLAALLVAAFGFGLLVMWATHWLKPIIRALTA